MPTREQLQTELEQAVDEAFDRYGAIALWSKRRPVVAEPDAARAIAYSLRLEGPAAARRLVERLEDLADALEPTAEPDPRRYRAVS